MTGPARRTNRAIRIDAEGWARGGASHIAHIPSPNCDARPDGVAISLVVIHGISLPPGEFGGRAIDALFTNTLDCDSHPYYEGLRGLHVSSHFLIRRDGALVQFVPCGMRAWHAGVSTFEGRERCNDFSVGIEFEGDDDTPFEGPQYDTVVALIGALTAHFPIDAIAGHDDIAPGRKTDPGPWFDWPALRARLDPALRKPVSPMP